MIPLWTPSLKRAAASRLSQFIAYAQTRADRPLADYADLHTWSVADVPGFWRTYADYAGLEVGASTVLSQGPMWKAKWFEGVTLNYAEKLLYPAALKDVSQTALIGVSETGAEEELSYAELRTLVACCRAALEREGVGPGDRVAAVACNLPVTTALLLACASLGAVFSSCSPDFGLEAASARLAQIEPKLLFGHPFYHYGGKRFDTAEMLLELKAALPSAAKLVLLPYVGEVSAEVQGAELWDAWLEPSASERYTPLDFNHPLYILYSSGTTGLPKAIVHRAGGAYLKHHTEHALHSDVRASDTVFYFSTCGWMMWNWLVSGLAQAATLVQFDGSPGQPDLSALWRLAERHKVSFFGTSARYLHGLQNGGVSPKKVADLSALRTVASTGSPLSESGFEFVYSDIKEDVHLASISGGTDIVGCFMLGVPTRPVYSGQIQGPALGADLVALNEAGGAVLGEPGELVCRTPLPSMPLKFWNDPGFERYQRAYFTVYEGLWRHGDLIEVTDQGGVMVYGRSDATLNPGGVRIGTAEIYRPLESFPNIADACAVGKRAGGDETIWLFVVLRPGEQLTDDLSARIKSAIRREASPRHVPGHVVQVSDLPRTRSGKTAEIAVSRLVNAQDVPNRQALANPEALEAIAAAI